MDPSGQNVRAWAPLYLPRVHMSWRQTPCVPHALPPMLPLRRLLETNAQFEADDIRRLAETLLDIVLHVS